MNALREIVTSFNNRITIEIPESLRHGTEFEVIILPVEKESRKISRLEFYGKYQDSLTIDKDFNEPLDDLREYME